MKQGIFRLLASVPALGVAMFLFSAGFPPLDDAAEADLTLHMMQHVLIILAGVAMAYPVLGRKALGGPRGGWASGAALVAASALIVFWHFPSPWDLAVINPGVHVLEHLSFLTVGLMSGSILLRLPDSAKIGALMAAFFGHMAYAVALISPWNVQVYSLFSLVDQALLGWVLLLTGPSLLVGVVYILVTNPSWLAGLSGQPAVVGERSRSFVSEASVPRWAAPACTLLLIGSLVGYYGYAGYALSTPQPVTGGPVVLIQETPVSWQYSPQHITVVVGVNSTVTWASRSISYDTVTDQGGTFSSGPIPPGQSFSYTFTAPGVYSYYCLYHPWMVGTVTVLAR